ncbi:hypothetical protein DAERI_060217 [Deinococcus aerius]|uniref:Uncharacterized protein n=1 Tax=Deinococcus aerius TaxID=200253 RepID=A0A2I9DTJ4_9DEIO|nr:hypothetical protein DAERI_060217 [Deinococcus aerius]
MCNAESTLWDEVFSPSPLEGEGWGEGWRAQLALVPDNEKATSPNFSLHIKRSKGGRRMNALEGKGPTWLPFQGSGQHR